MGRNETDIDAAIAGLQGVKLADKTYASSADAHEIIDRICAALECHGPISKYVAEGIRQDRMSPADQTPAHPTPAHPTPTQPTPTQPTATN